MSPHLVCFINIQRHPSVFSPELFTRNDEKKRKAATFYLFISQNKSARLPRRLKVIYKPLVPSMTHFIQEVEIIATVRNLFIATFSGVFWWWVVRTIRIQIKLNINPAGGGEDPKQINIPVAAAFVIGTLELFSGRQWMCLDNVKICM